MNIFGFNINFLYGKKKKEYEVIENLKKELKNEIFNRLVNENGLNKLVDFLNENKEVGILELVSLVAVVADRNKTDFLPVAFKDKDKVKYAIFKLVDDDEFVEEYRNSF